MQFGDIDNRPAPRVIFVFEGTIGTLSAVNERKRRLFLATHQWERAARCWTIEPFLQKVLIDMAWRSPYNVDLATYLHPAEAVAVEKRLGELGLPFGHFHMVDLDEMLHVICTMPHVAAVYDFDPSRVFTYGSKGRSMVGL